MAEIPSENANPEMDVSLNLALMRTQLAHDQTLLSWVRTVLAMSGAGLAFDKGAAFLHQQKILEGTAILGTSHLAALILVGAGILLLIRASWEFSESKKTLAKLTGLRASRMPAPLAAAVLMIVLCCAALVLLIVTG